MPALERQRKCLAQKGKQRRQEKSNKHDLPADNRSGGRHDVDIARPEGLLAEQQRKDDSHSPAERAGDDESRRGGAQAEEWARGAAHLPMPHLLPQRLQKSALLNRQPAADEQCDGRQQYGELRQRHLARIVLLRFERFFDFVVTVALDHTAGDHGAKHEQDARRDASDERRTGHSMSAIDELRCARLVGRIGRGGWTDDCDDEHD